MLLVAAEVQFFDLLNFAFASSGNILSCQWCPIERAQEIKTSCLYCKGLFC